eukprot:gene26143-32033_t
MAGIGLTMEAINQNPVMYELALDHIWSSGPRDMTDWLRTWVAARYGSSMATEEVHAAWQVLLRTCYDVLDKAQGNGFWGVTKSVIEKRPSLIQEQVVMSGFQETKLKYDACELITAWSSLIAAARDAETRLQPLAALALAGSAFLLDLLDVSRQVLSNLAMALFLEMTQRIASSAGQSGDKPGMNTTGGMLRSLRLEFLNICDDLDTMLGTEPHFMLGPWVEGAKRLADANMGAQERALYEFNARNLVTRWGPNGQISDYSSRLWSGLISDYYKPRWQLVLDFMVDHYTGSRLKGTYEQA